MIHSIIHYIYLPLFLLCPSCTFHFMSVFRFLFAPSTCVLHYFWYPYYMYTILVPAFVPRPSSVSNCFCVQHLFPSSIVSVFTHCSSKYSKQIQNSSVVLCSCVKRFKSCLNISLLASFNDFYKRAQIYILHTCSLLIRTQLKHSPFSTHILNKLSHCA